MKYFFSLKNGGIKVITKKRKVTMYQFGDTTGLARYPLFVNNVYKTRVSMLPHPVTNSRPGEIGHAWLTYTPWIRPLTFDVANITRHYYGSLKTSHENHTLSMIKECKHKVHSSLKMCNTFCTQMILPGSGLHSGMMKYQVDDEDYITSVVTFGSIDMKSGSQVYLNGTDSSCVGFIQQAISFHHERIQIGNFDNIYHGVSPNVGFRCTIVYCMKKNLDHFLTYGNKLYDKSVQFGYPSHEYVAS